MPKILNKLDERDNFELFKTLNQKVRFLGGFETCFNLEAKTRIFIDTILEFVCNRLDQQ